MNRFILIITLFIVSFQTTIAQNLKITNLRTEYLENPIGIDNLSPRFTWNIVSDDLSSNNDVVSYKVIVGSDSLALQNGKGDQWKSDAIKSELQLCTYAGKSLLAETKYFWKVELSLRNKVIQSSIKSFETGKMDFNNWKGYWISDNKREDVRPAPYFRKTFPANKKVISARVYIAAGGLYELYINGERIGDHQLDPMFTRYDKRNLYVTYDVTNAIQNGKNAIGVILGNGWYNFQSIAVWDYERAPWRNRPTFCFDLNIIYSDGTKETISSDNSWKTTLGPIVYNSIYTGQHFDARKELIGWDKNNFDDSKWDKAKNRQAPSSNITAQTLQPIRHVEAIQPIEFKKINDTTWLYNIGRNIAGVTQLKLDGDSNTIVRVVHAERLDKSGKIDQSNVDYFLRDAKKNNDPFATDIYHLSGRGLETYAPHFDYKGFQYVEVISNKPINISKESLIAFSMHSDVPSIGNISSSNIVLNKINSATRASYLANLFGYPTDCPQREKNGWTGDAHIAIETGLYNFDAITIYEKWLADMRDEQQPNGTLPSIVPTDGWGYDWGNGPDWTSAVAIIPWNIYLFYGDSKILKDNYENIKNYVDRVTTTAPNGLTSWGLGDWIPVKSKTPVELTSSIYYYTDVEILCKTAKLFNKEKDYQFYNSLKEKIKKAINDKYLNREKGIYGEGFQTELAAPLYWGIVPNDLKLKVAENLAKNVAKNNFHLDVGLLGTKAILSALSDNGQSNTAYKLAAQESYPSWGWWIVNGATTLYENWNIDAQRDLSLNHIMFGEIGAWLYKGLAGIKPDEEKPGFKNVILSPHFVEGLDSFSAQHTGPFGAISSTWRKENNAIVYEVVIPINATATVQLDDIENKSVYLNDKKISHTNPIHIGAGKYVFTIKK